MREELLSVVIPADEDSAATFDLIDALGPFLSARFRNYEVIVVTDPGDAALAHALSARVESMRNLRVLTLARHYGTAVATLAGLQHAIGDFTIVLHGGDPVAVVDDMLAALTPEMDVVFAMPQTSQSWQGKILTGIAQMSRLPMPAGAGHIALLRRRALNAILTLRDRIVHLPLLAAYLGLRVATIPVLSSSSLKLREVGGQLEAICAYSPWPLWLLAVGVLSLTGLGTALCFLQWILSGIFDGPSFVMLVVMMAVTGLASMMVVMTSFVGRILQETKRQPLYYVTAEQSSRKVQIEGIVQKIETKS